MPRSVNGKPGATITTVLQDQNPPIPLHVLLEKSISDIQEKRRREEFQRMSAERRKLKQLKGKP